MANPTICYVGGSMINNSLFFTTRRLWTVFDVFLVVFFAWLTCLQIPNVKNFKSTTVATWLKWCFTMLHEVQQWSCILLGWSEIWWCWSLHFFGQCSTYWSISTCICSTSGRWIGCLVEMMRKMPPSPPKKRHVRDTSKCHLFLAYDNNHNPESRKIYIWHGLSTQPTW